ncbi:MAG: DNA primase [Paramuribaculum sp.]|nr:DNA primase [Paramuribaculum sp.]
MKRIDHETVRKIIDTADIVDVVSDFVSLKRRGANYKGLCPFHNDRNPSFTVSKSKNICKCFVCGTGGSPVNFIMLHEKLNFNEALRYLANKYHIEIKEEELSEDEQQKVNDRESMLAVNDFALGFFEHTMSDTDEGRAIGLSYFRERGISDAMISRFRLGYSPEKRDALAKAAVEKGYLPEYLVSTGLCFANDKGELRDKFHGRVIYPILSLSGKVVAFGGRTLRKEKDIAKYVNSPESIIYSKRRELYGLFQAKKAIVNKDKCLLVEGYMDVISLHQSGVENAVASSGTALTSEQINLIHRFTDNVTLIYDADPAGIKASLRGIDLLLEEGMNIKVLLLPEGEDPDSFAQSHTAEEVEKYIADNETDFIAFKTRTLMADADNDPVARGKVINDIVMSIAKISDDVTRLLFVGECARSLNIDEKVLSLQTAKFRAQWLEKAAHEREIERNRRQSGVDSNTPDQPVSTPETDAQVPVETINYTASAVAEPKTPVSYPEENVRKFLRPNEWELIKYVVKYSMATFCENENDPDGLPMTVIDYISNELMCDDITFSNPDIDAVFQTALKLRELWPENYRESLERATEMKRRLLEEGYDKIRATATGMADIEKQEKELEQEVDRRIADEIDMAACNFAQHSMLSDPDDTVRKLSTELAAERYQLSRIHTKYSHVETERERLSTLVPRAVYELKYAQVELSIKKAGHELRLAQASGDNDAIMTVMQQLIELNDVKKLLAKYLGERIVSARH